MKKITLFLIICISFCLHVNSQSVINITTSGGNFTGEKWVSITTAPNGGGTQVWGQGNGTQCDGSGLINQDISIAPGTYYVNCYDQYDDGWDGTLITVTAYGNVIGDNGGVSPSDGEDTDASSACEGTEEEFEASFEIIVPNPPPCQPPSALTATNITDTTADLGWTENGTATVWDIEVVTNGTPATGTPTALGIGNPYMASGLTEQTAYDFYVRADCGGDGTSAWAGPFAFTTPCAALTPYYNADMSVNVPNCWNEANSGNATTGPMGIGSSSWVSSNHNGTSSNRFNLYFENRIGWIISPVFDLSGSAPSELKVYVALTESGTSGSGADLGSDDKVSLLMTTDGGASWSSLQDWVQGNVPSDVGEEIAYDLTAQTGTVQFAFLADEGSVNDLEDIYFHVSKFEVREIPACPEPTAAMVANVTNTSADVSWTEAGTATVWNIEIVDITAGGTPTGIPTISGITNPYTVTGLTANNNYEYYVQADCGGDGTSAWVGPQTFTTACSAFTAPFTEGFENGGTIPNCWTLTGDDTWLFNTSGPNHVGNGGTLSGSTPSGNYYAVVDDSDPTATNAGLVSPLVDLTPLSTPALSFYQISDNEGQANATLTVEVWDGAAWNSVGIYNTNTLGWEERLIDLSGLTFTGPAQVRFLVADSGSFYDDIAIDDVSFLELPSCLAPSALMVANVTQTSADFSWTENNGSTTWEVVVQAAGTGTPTGAGTQVTGMATYTDNTLVSVTDYEFFVRTDCGGGTFSSWTGPLNFTTTPSNDECIDAIPLTPGGTFSTNPVVGTNAGASDSSGVPAPGCASYQGGDVWFSTVVPSDGIITLEINPQAGGIGDTGGAVYSGTCGALALVACNDDGSASGAHPIIDINDPALANQTVYFRVWEFGNNATGEFQVSAYAASLSVESAEVRGFTHYTDKVNNRFVVNAQSNISSIEVYNLVGQIITTARPNTTSGFANLPSKANGVYFARVTLENGRTSIVKFAK